jgi:hypothetical protein
MNYKITELAHNFDCLGCGISYSYDKNLGHKVPKFQHIVCVEQYKKR